MPISFVRNMRETKHNLTSSLVQPYSARARSNAVKRTNLLHAIGSVYTEDKGTCHGGSVKPATRPKQHIASHPRQHVKSGRMADLCRGYVEIGRPAKVDATFAAEREALLEDVWVRTIFGRRRLFSSADLASVAVVVSPVEHGC